MNIYEQIRSEAQELKTLNGWSRKETDQWGRETVRQVEKCEDYASALQMVARLKREARAKPVEVSRYWDGDEEHELCTDCMLATRIPMDSVGPGYECTTCGAKEEGE